MNSAVNPYDFVEESNVIRNNSCMAGTDNNYEPAEPSNEYARIKHPSFDKQGDNLYDKLYKPKPDDSGFNQSASITQAPAEPAVQYAVIDKASKKRKIKPIQDTTDHECTNPYAAI